MRTQACSFINLLNARAIHLNSRGLHEAMHCGSEEPGIHLHDLPFSWILPHCTQHSLPHPWEPTMCFSFQFHIQWCPVAILSLVMVVIYITVINKAWKQAPLENWLINTTLCDLQLITQSLCSFFICHHFLSTLVFLYSLRPLPLD